VLFNALDISINIKQYAAIAKQTRM